jgi:hypothetical protein
MGIVPQRWPKLRGPPHSSERTCYPRLLIHRNKAPPWAVLLDSKRYPHRKVLRARGVSAPCPSSRFSTTGLAILSRRPISVDVLLEYRKLIVS